MSEFKAGDRYEVLKGATYIVFGQSSAPVSDFGVEVGEIVTVRGDFGETTDSDGDVRVYRPNGNHAWISPSGLKPYSDDEDEAEEGQSELAEENPYGLDMRRVLAAQSAAAILGTPVFGGGSAEEITYLAAFLLGEEVPA